MKRWVILAIQVSVVLPLSCTRVAFTDMETTHAKYSWDFQQAISTNRLPDTMFVALARTVNTIHDTVAASTADPDTLWIENGDYHAVTCGWLRKDAYSIENLDQFLQKGPLSGSDARIAGVMDLYALLPAEEESEYDVLSQTLFPKTNTDMPVVSHADSLWVGSDHRELQWKGEQVDILQFGLEEKTVELTVRLGFISEDPARTVDRVAAALVGVPSRVKIQNGTVGLDGLGRSIFEMRTSDKGTEKTFTGKLRCLGLFPPVNSGDKYSYGILHVAFQMSGDPKILETKINLYFLLQKHPVLKELEQSGRFLLSSHKATLDLPASKVSVHIKKKVEGEEDKDAVSVWVEDENSELDVIPEDGEQL